jgi:hypothetical protein
VEGPRRGQSLAGKVIASTGARQPNAKRPIEAGVFSDIYWSRSNSDFINEITGIRSNRSAED